jgi:hypothetical protein
MAQRIRFVLCWRAFEMKKILQQFVGEMWSLSSGGVDIRNRHDEVNFVRLFQPERIYESLPVELKIFQFYIVHSNLIERIFHLILNVVKRD